MAKHRYVTADDVATVAQALADPTRLRVLHALSEGELCVCQITELAGLAPSTVSRHMAVLQSAGLVESRKEARWVYYSLPEEPDALTAGAVGWALGAFASTEQAKSDRRSLQEIVQCDPGELCRKQKRT
jgi:ArsR family transcriptional regulator